MRPLPLILALAATPLAIASPQLSAPDANGFVWATIGAPGNPHAPQVGDFWSPNPPRGAVDYKYRMSQTELTVGQWFEFVNAYSTFAEFPNSPSFTGGLIFSNFDGTYFIVGNQDVVKNLPNSTAPRFAARYINWLHNGQINEAWAFESGVYDTSTFGTITVNGSTVYTDDYTPAPGAKYWIPSLDEWVKAMYYDPNRYGEGKGGYWSYPHSSDALPIYGLPEDGGETNAGSPDSIFAPLLPVGSYPEVQSPWGLLDGSGGATELVNYEAAAIGFPGRLSAKGSSYMTSEILHAEGEHYEQLYYGLSPYSNLAGLRIASAVPGPGGAMVVLFVLSTVAKRKRKQ